MHSADLVNVPVERNLKPWDARLPSSTQTTIQLVIPPQNTTPGQSSAQPHCFLATPLGETTAKV